MPRQALMSEMFLEIPAGTRSEQIAALLKSHGLIWSRYAFDAMRLVKGGTLKAGEYRFDHPARMSEVYARLERGDVYTRTLTIPEGANMFDIAQRVEAAQLGSKETFLEAVKRNATLISDLDPGAQNVEGYLFPDTYHFQRLETPDQMIAHHGEAVPPGSSKHRPDAELSQCRNHGVACGTGNAYWQRAPYGRERIFQPDCQEYAAYDGSLRDLRRLTEWKVQGHDLPLRS